MEEITKKAILEIKTKLNRHALLFRSTSQGNIVCWIEMPSEMDGIDEYKLALISRKINFEP